MKLILLYFLLLSSAIAQPIININSDKSALKEFKLSYFINDAKLKFKDRGSMVFKEGENKDTLGAKVTDVWIKINFFNSTQKNQTLFLHEDLAYTFATIEYFEVNSSNNLLNKKTINILGDNTEEELNGSDAVFEFKLHPRESKTIYVHQTTPAYHFYSYYIFSEKESIEYLIYEKVDAVLLVGLLLALALYNFLIFLSSRYKEYLYYSLYLVSSTLWIFYMYGAMAHYFHLYGEIPFKFNFGLMLNPIFLALFVQSIFNTKTEYKTEHKFLNSIIIILLFNFIYALIDFNQALQFLSLILNYVMFVFLGIAISIYLKGNKIIKIFLFAHIFYIFFNIYGLLFYLGMVDSTYISSHGVGIGIAIEALLLSYLVSYKFKIMEQEKEKERLSKLQAIEEQNRSQQNNKLLQNLIDERELLLREVFHRVKNNFHTIIGMLWLESTKKGNDAQQFSELINRTKSMSMIHEYLYNSEDLVHINLKEYLDKIINTLLISNVNANATTTNTLEEITVEFNYALSIGMIVNEILNNAIKHNTQQEFSITIDLQQNENIVTLTIVDNGSGFDPSSHTDGLGLKLISQFCKKLLNSQYTFVSEKGTKFELKFEN